MLLFLPCLHLWCGRTKFDSPALGLTPCGTQEALSLTGLFEYRDSAQESSTDWEIAIAVDLRRSPLGCDLLGSTDLTSPESPAYCQSALAIARRGSQFYRRESGLNCSSYPINTEQKC
ncbi:hypothetical protein DAPPUDRAFT_256796 [Daphnia pulex]|uniref:Uncharacterized protein n=1 Tax=Daphnia pulex TaxID=6669 RepID=E9HC39_DAPPU|nr:hypothetical protein DAPPUDRAFT_256796 [Daphnia pulex]|eukprot:EFX70727.1 hypothetical protein DAPPUDRAFT_256796 [Daphnia pulex]